jgi:HYR domain
LITLILLFFPFHPLLSTIHGQSSDATPPVITVPDDITTEATGPDGAQVSFEVYAYDYDTDGPVDVNCDYNSGNTFPIGETEVTCTAEDSAGNSEEEFFTITIEDTTPPVITVPQDIIEEATGPDGAQVSFEVYAEDVVDGPVDVICDYNSGNTFLIGDTEVKCSATDEAGNPAEEFFVITVEEPAVVPQQQPNDVVPQQQPNDVVPQQQPNDVPVSPETELRGGSGETTITSDLGWVIPLTVLVSIVIGGIALGKYKMNRRSRRRIEIPPSAIVGIRAKGGIDRL